MALSLLTPAVLAGAFAAAIAFAPAAAADDDSSAGSDAAGPDTSQQDDLANLAQADGPDRNSPNQSRPSTVPKGWTNEALWSNSPNIFGSLPKPPIYALD